MAGSMDGLALAGAVREKYPDMAILLVSGYSNVSEAASGNFIVMRKPFKLAELSRVSTRLIAEAKQPETTNIIRLRDARPGSSPPGRK